MADEAFIIRGNTLFKALKWIGKDYAMVQDMENGVEGEMFHIELNELATSIDIVKWRNK